METRIEMSRMYDTLLAAPGMNQSVKISLSISRRTALLLNQLIENGIAQKEKTGQPGIIASLPLECFQEIEQIGIELLQRADMIELNEKLKKISES